jgi:hypothetical protein
MQPNPKADLISTHIQEIGNGNGTGQFTPSFILDNLENDVTMF